VRATPLGGRRELGRKQSVRFQ